MELLDNQIQITSKLDFLIFEKPKHWSINSELWSGVTRFNDFCDLINESF